ncbi:SIS domain-containing protein [Candidatus Pseudothioglobus singularis]|nr:SIS domain-containing protein [Candidatus Pseudothioglobus singularis]
MIDLVRTHINRHLKVANSLHDLSELIVKCSELCIQSLKKDGKIILFGNGGSAADAQHIAAELVGRYKINRKALSAIALTTDTSTLTSIANDFGYEHIFARQVEALANEGDIVIGISTSGTSSNVIKAFKVASNLGCTIIGLSGHNSLEMDKLCNINIAVPSTETATIQEIHIIIGHTICMLIENELTN